MLLRVLRMARVCPVWLGENQDGCGRWTEEVGFKQEGDVTLEHAPYILEAGAVPAIASFVS